MKPHRKLYITIGQALSPIAVVCLQVYSALTNRPRVRVIVANEFGEVLLLKGIISYHGYWTFPGGGVGRHEDAVDAAIREVHEETGILLTPSKVSYMRTIPKKELGLDFDVPLFLTHVKKSDLPPTLYNSFEIAEMGWFPMNKLPARTAHLVTHGLKEYTK